MNGKAEKAGALADRLAPRPRLGGLCASFLLRPPTRNSWVCRMWTGQRVTNLSNLERTQCFKEQRWSTVAASVVSTGAIGPSVHPPDEAPAGLSLSSQRVRLMLITSTQGSVHEVCWVVLFFFLTQSA